MKQFNPSYFAFVMATGIICLDVSAHGYHTFAEALFGVNAVAYPVLWLITALRLICYPGAVAGDLSSHARAPGFLTMVAATSLVGGQISSLSPFQGLAGALWFVSIGLWVLIGYAFLILITTSNPKPPIETGLNGAWLLLTVATQSLVVLGTSLKDKLPAPEITMFACMSFYVLGAALYIVLIGIIVYRWAFAPVRPEELSPTFWINSGAASITTLAGARLLSTGFPEIQAIMDRGFVAPFTLLFWAAATWWIPLLLLADFWRHVVRRVPVAYSPAWWAVVFPLGMYATCTNEYAHATSLSFLMPISNAFTWIAIAAWTVGLAGMTGTILSSLWRFVTRAQVQPS